MGLLSGGFVINSGFLKAAGLGHFAARNGIKALAAHNGIKTGEIWPEDGKLTVTKLATAVGGAVWAGGVAANNHVMQTWGPAVNAAASLTSAVLQYSQGEAGWVKDLVGVAENAAFAAAGPAGNPVARTLAFGSAAAGFFLEAQTDKGFLGHVLGECMWAMGAATETNSLEAAGAGLVAASEVARFVYRMYENYARPVPERPGYEPIRQPTSAATTGPASGTSAPYSVNPVATASVSVASAMYGRFADLPLSPVSSAVSLPVSPILPGAQLLMPGIPAPTLSRRASDGGEVAPARPGTVLAQMPVPERTLPAPLRRHSR
ncbi:hypothetical protein ACJ6WF_13880 [Streptomyces sp. MMS24-I2-30]|uniref:hypothetical protein n=1 Tax=Streptomyces sp. MMS24-I2-30 TaxID=3351564 RepID=UPI003896ECCB